MKEQLEVYKIILRGNDGDTFGKLITDKFGKARSKNPSDVFLKMFKCIISELDKKVWKSKSLLQGLTILKQKAQDINQIITSHSGHFVIEGYIDGGHYDMIRQLTELSNTSNTTAITRDKMVSDRFYIYMQIDPSQNVGILMIEKKGQLSISASLCKYIEQFFKVTNSRKCKVVRYIPPYLIEEFKNGSVVESITCSDQVVKQILDQDGMVVRDSHYDVTIKIKPTDSEDLSGDKTHLVNQIKEMVFSIIGKQGKKLNDFSVKKGNLKQPNGSSCQFELDDEGTIRPIINIDEDLLSENKDYLKRDQIKALCDDILNKIKNDIYAIG